MTEEMKGDLEVIINYMDTGLIKTRIKNVKEAELPIAFKDATIAILKALLQAKNGQLPENAMPLYSQEQFEKI